MKKKIGIVHCTATCEDCGAEFSNYLNAQALSAKHAKKHRHKVSGRVGIAFWYDGRKREK